MKVVYAEAARSDLDHILDYTSRHFPGQLRAVEERIRSVVRRIADWPESARAVEGEPGVRVAPVLRYPFLVFYRATPDAIEILRIRHTARTETPEGRN